jgi:hypothetical protein
MGNGNSSLNRPWTKKEVIQWIKIFHKQHTKIHKERKPYEFDIKYVLYRTRGMPGGEIIQQISDELVNTPLPIRDDAQKLLIKYVCELYDLWYGSEKTKVFSEALDIESYSISNGSERTNGQDTSSHVYFNDLMSVIFICYVCGDHEHENGYRQCTECKKTFCHKCWIEYPLEKKCMYCAC